MEKFVERNKKIAEAFEVLFNSTLEMLYKVNFRYYQSDTIAQQFNLLAACAEKIDGYNRFTARGLMKMVHRIDELVGRAFFNEGNPNNGTAVFDVELGRDSSVVCFITVDYKNTDHTPAEVERLIERAARDAKCDEFRMVEEYTSPYMNQRRYRIWWD